MDTLAVVCNLLVGILGISELPAISKRFDTLESARGKKVRVILLVVLLALSTGFQQLAQRASEDARAKAEASRDAMLAVVAQGVGALKAAEDGRASEQAARVKAERQRDETLAAAAERDARLRFSWTPLPGRSVDVARVKTPVTITQEMVEDRKEYLLMITNPSGYGLSDASFSLEFPYPVESSELSRALGVIGLAFQPVGSRVSGSSTGGGTVQVRPGGCTWSYALTVSDLRPDAQLEIFVRLYSGARVPEAHAGGVHWRYRYPLRGELAERSLSAPFQVGKDKTVLIGAQHPAPRTPPSLSIGFANCSLP